MASSPNLQAKLTIDDQARAVLAQFGKEIESVNAKAKAGATQTTSLATATDKVTTSWKKAAVGLGMGAVGLATVTSAARSAISAGSALAESQSKVNVVFGQSAVEIHAWSKTAAASMGMSAQAALEAAGTYGNLFQAFGLGREQATEMSTTLVQLASDLASFNNTSTEDALNALRSGLSGEMEPMKRYGAALTDARLRQEALNMGIYDGKGILDANQKAQAAYALILKDTALAQGDYARTADGAANTMRSFQAATDDLSASVGTGMLTAIMAVSKALGGTSGATGGMAAFGREMENAGRGVAYLVGGVKFLVDAIGTQGLSGEMSSAIGQTIMLSNTFSSIANIVDGVRAVFDQASDSYYRMTTLLTDAEMGYRDAEGALHLWKDGVETVIPVQDAAAAGASGLAGEVAGAGEAAKAATPKVTALASAMGLLDNTVSRQQALASFKESLRTFVAEPSMDAAYQVIQNFDQAYDSFKEGGKRQAQFVVDNYDEMVETIKTSGLSESAQSELIRPLKDAYAEAQKTLDALRLIVARKWSTDVVINRILSGSLPVFGDGAAMGGFISGPGTGTSDSIPARLSNGEYVIRAAAVKSVGRGFLDSVNAQGYARGGPVRRPAGLNAILGTATQITNQYANQTMGPKVTGANDWYLIEQGLNNFMRAQEEAADNEKRAAQERERAAEEAAREQMRMMEELHRQQQAIISAARATLQVALTSRDDFAASVASSGIGYGSITGWSAAGGIGDDWAALSRRAPGSEGAGGPASMGAAGSSISGYMATRLARVQRFGDVVKRLAGAGLNLSTLREVISAGPDQGTTLGEALLESGIGEIGRVNSIQTQLEDVSGGIGAFAGNTIMGGAVTDAYGNYTGVVMANGGVDDTPLQVNLLLDGQTVVTQLLAIKRSRGGVALGIG